MASRSPARWLAPLALVGSIAAVMIVLAASDGGGSTETDAATTAGITGSTATQTSTTSTTSSAGTRRFYTVKEGDVLSAIADSTGVPLTEIEQLNPDVDAQTLHAGQRIKLRP